MGDACVGLFTRVISRRPHHTGAVVAPTWWMRTRRRPAGTAGNTELASAGRDRSLNPRPLGFEAPPLTIVLFLTHGTHGHTRAHTGTRAHARAHTGTCHEPWRSKEAALRSLFCLTVHGRLCQRSLSTSEKLPPLPSLVPGPSIFLPSSLSSSFPCLRPPFFPPLHLSFTLFSLFHETLREALRCAWGGRA